MVVETNSKITVSKNPQYAAAIITAAEAFCNCFTSIPVSSIQMISVTRNGKSSFYISMMLSDGRILTVGDKGAPIVSYTSAWLHLSELLKRLQIYCDTNVYKFSIKIAVRDFSKCVITYNKCHKGINAGAFGATLTEEGA